MNAYTQKANADLANAEKLLDAEFMQALTKYGYPNAVLPKTVEEKYAFVRNACLNSKTITQEEREKDIKYIDDNLRRLINMKQQA
jgi:hypothetical protein